MAVKTWDGAQKDLDGAREDLDGAQEDLDFARRGLRQAVQNGDEKERKEAKEEFDKAKEEFEKAKEKAKRAESKVQTAKEEATKAKEELEKAKSMAPLQAGGAQLLLFVRSTIFASWGHALLSARVPLFVKLFSLCWLAAQAGAACFALALRSPGCSCFCLRLDFQVAVSVRGGQGPGFLVPAFSTRTLKSTGVPARRVPAGGMLPLACSTPACPGLLVVVRFRAVHRCCFLGCCFPQQGSPCG